MAVSDQKLRTLPINEVKPRLVQRVPVAAPVTKVAAKQVAGKQVAGKQVRKAARDYSLKQAPLNQQAARLLKKDQFKDSPPDADPAAVIQKVRDEMFEVGRRAKSARQAALAVLNGGVGLTGQERADANSALASVNSAVMAINRVKGAISPSSLTDARVTKNGSAVTRAVVARALWISTATDEKTKLPDETARLQEDRWDQMSDHEKFVATVAEFDRLASAEAVRENNQVMAAPEPEVAMNLGLSRGLVLAPPT